MIFRQLTGIGDWTFGRGIYSYATAENAIALNIQTRLLSWKTDCFWAQTDFVDWLGRLDKGQETNLLNELQSVLLASFGVIGINSFVADLNRQTRKFTVTYNISTIYSQSFLNSLDLAAGLPTGS